MIDNIREIKNRFGLVGSDPKLDQAIETAVQVAPIQLSVLIVGESGSGKESFPQIIHAFSKRKHNNYVAVNCGAIPEGTIDSELFGHLKGSFTGAVSDRKGYFEEANGGTIFLDEIGELPLATQAKLLRVLEKGEFMRVGSSLVQKTDVRIVAATNIDLEQAIQRGRFREDLYYRLNGVTVRIPSLRSRRGDIIELFHRFTNDFADQNKIKPVELTASAERLLTSYSWPGNVRQLKNTTNQVTALAKNRVVDAEELERFMPKPGFGATPIGGSMLPQIDGQEKQTFNSEREILYKILFDMRKDVSDLKKLVLEMVKNGQISQENAPIVQRLYQSEQDEMRASRQFTIAGNAEPTIANREESITAMPIDTTATVVVDEPMIKMGKVSEVQDVEVQEPRIDTAEAKRELFDKEKEVILLALKKHNGRRKLAAAELGISERTLYRKIHEYGIDQK